MVKNNKLNVAKSKTSIKKNTPIKLSLKDTNLKFRTVFDLSSDGILISRVDGKKFVDANEKICSMLGYTRDEILNIGIDDIHPVESLSYVIRQTEKLAQKEKLFAKNLPMLRKDKSVIFADLNARLISLNGFKFIIGVFRDINEFRKEEDKLLFISKALESSSDAIDIADPEGRLLYQNKTSTDLFKYTLEELDDAGGISALFVNKNIARQSINNMMRGKSWSGETEMISKNGRKFTASIRMDAIKDDSGKIVGLIGLAKDISDNRKVEEILRKSEAQYRLLADHMKDAVWLMDMDLKWKFISPSLGRLLGYTLDEVKEMSLDQILTPASFQKARDFYSTELSRIRSSPRPNSVGSLLEIECNCKDGNTLWGETMFSFIRDKEGKPLLILGEGRDITRRKQVEHALQESETKYRNIFENAQEGIYQSTPDGKFITANQSMARILGYDSPAELMAGIADIANQLYVDARERKKVLNMINENGFAKVREVRFYRKDGRIIWVSRTMRAVHDEQGSIIYYEGIIEDITEKKESIARLRNALGGTVRALASVIETRDPYTAGHQRKVGDLARAIAKEMELPGDQIEGLRIAAIIHDIGKISVPSELLSKPRRLTDLEIDLIRTHARYGYEILKGIEFPWPVANIVLEHHERMDGSGYPQNIKGEDILLEARILAVADVVEAMASHRPYRESLGIEAALGEIEKNRKILYDEKAVDACLRLFREKDYRLA
jgi:PAS domain S-box-containing protein/putative nucleotidyltransferase with HDIG domain